MEIRSSYLRRAFALLILLVVLITLSACGGLDRMGNKDINQPYEMNDRTQRLQKNSDNDTTIGMPKFNNQHYISIQQLIDRLQMRSRWDAETKTFGFGDNDIIYQIQEGTTEAGYEGETFQLPDEPVLNDQGLFITEASFYDLFSEMLDFQVSGDNLVIHGNHDALYTRPFQIEKQNGSMDDALDFDDDSNDPSKDAEDNNDDEDATASSLDNKTEAWPVQGTGDVNVSNLISSAKKYVGVPYEFGAEQFTKTGTFDCSSFVRYVYGKQGIDLPRISKNQAEKGSYVSRKNLRRGDLMYFYVPGRFKTNKTIGHVGIYMGNNKMIHSSPQPEDGVQITDINKDYWKDTYLKSKRVI